MRFFKMFLVVLAALALTCFSALAQTAGVPVIPAAAPVGVVGWIQSNWGLVIAPLGVAVIDFLVALNPTWKSNGIIHAIFLFLGGKDPSA